MNADDYYRIRALAEAGGYGDPIFSDQRASVFKLPDVDLYNMWSALYAAIDWHRLFSDFLNRMLTKFGSFANDWYFGCKTTVSDIVMSQPGLEDNIDSCDFARMQNIVLRLLKLKASAPIFLCCSWREFEKDCIQSRSETFEHGTHPRMSDAQFAAIVRENDLHNYNHGKLPTLRYLIHSIIYEPDCFRLDDLIALHRGGKYTLPGRRVDLSWLQYAD